jgi:hypothetical protein
LTLGTVAALLLAADINAQNATLHPQPHYVEQVPLDLKASFGTAGDWKAVVTAAAEPEGEIESHEGPSQSKICFVRTSSTVSECTYFRDLFQSDLTFQVSSGLSVVSLTEGRTPVKGLLLKASAWYPAGQTHETAIWVYDAQRDDFDLALGVVSGEEHIFSNGPLNGMLVTADSRADDGETRASEHTRDVKVYRFVMSHGAEGYRKVLEYTTTMKYGAEDSDTVDAELSNIEAKLQ